MLGRAGPGGREAPDPAQLPRQPHGRSAEDRGKPKAVEGQNQQTEAR